MTKCTSKASYNEIRESGAELSQSDKIFDIINLGGDLSMQEIMKIYRGKWGSIELSSISARCNKLKEQGKIIEAKPRKCAITDKTINPLTTNKCTHDRYRSNDYMCHPKALKDENIVLTGMIIKKCTDCGADISHAKRAPVLTATEYLRRLGK